MIWFYALPEPNQSIQLPVCVRYNAVTKTVITASLFMIFCRRQLQVTFPSDVGGVVAAEQGSAIMKESQCYTTLSCEIWTDVRANITSVDCSAAAGVKAARPKMPCHLLAVTCSCLGAFVMDSDEPELLNVPLPNKADQRESGRKWRPGRWCLQLVPRRNPSPPCVDSVCSSRTTVPLQVSAQAGILHYL